MDELRLLPRFDDAQQMDLGTKTNSIYRYNPLLYVSSKELIHANGFYNENQADDIEIRTKNVTNDRSNRFDINVHEQTYDRTGRTCWPIVNTNVGKIDLEYTYEIVGNTLESYIRSRKLNQCKALSDFIEYRNRVFKREKIGQYALTESKTSMKEIPNKQMLNIPTKIIHIDQTDTSSISSSPSTLTQSIPTTPIPSSPNLIPKASERLPTPLPSSHSINLKTPQKSSTPLPSGQSLTPKTSQKLATHIPSIHSATSKTSHKSATSVTSSQSLNPKSQQKSPSPLPSPSTTSKTSHKSITPAASSQSLKSKSQQKTSSSLPSPSATSKTSHKSTTPVPSLQSLKPKSQQKASSPLPSPSVSSKASQKLSTPVPSSKSSNLKTPQKSSSPLPSSPSLKLKTSQKPSSTAVTPKASEKEAFISIPSPNLLRNPNKINNSKKSSNANVKQISSPPVKGSSRPKSKTKKHKTCTIL